MAVELVTTAVARAHDCPSCQCVPNPQPTYLHTFPDNATNADVVHWRAFAYPRHNPESCPDCQPITARPAYREPDSYRDPGY